MELALNLAWVLLAGCLFCLWLRYAQRTATEAVSGHRMQLVALAVLIIVLLPVISMTDDLLAAQNPAEAVSCVRRDHDDSWLLSIVPTAEPPVPILPSVLLSVAFIGLPINAAVPLVKPPALSTIQNRPPPSA